MTGFLWSRPGPDDDQIEFDSDMAYLKDLAAAILAVMQDGYTPYQAGQILYLSVNEFCPQYLDRVVAFAHSGDTTA